MKLPTTAQSQVNCFLPAEGADVALWCRTVYYKTLLKLLEKPEARNYRRSIRGLQINHILGNESCPLYRKSLTCSRY